MDAYSNIAFERIDSLAIIRFSRPAVLNAISTELARETVDALTACGRDPDVAAVILTGAGDRAFSAGVDLVEANRLGSDDIEVWFRQISNIYREILLLEKPVIAALNGIAAGAGYQIALVSDLRVGCTRSSISQPEINAGLPSIMGSYWMTYFLPRSLNQEMSYTGRVLDAEECVRFGLLNDMVSPGDLIDRASERAQELSNKSPTAFQKTKEAFRETALSGFNTAYTAALEGMTLSYKRGEPQKMMKKFLSK
jgi:enoyl-CoA hydratase